MLRYVKANGQWYDTLSELKKGNTYHEVDGLLYIVNSNGVDDHYVGVVEEESDTYVESEG